MPPQADGTTHLVVTVGCEPGSKECGGCVYLTLPLWDSMKPFYGCPAASLLSSALRCPACRVAGVPAVPGSFWLGQVLEDLARRRDEANVVSTTAEDVADRERWGWRAQAFEEAIHQVRAAEVPAGETLQTNQGSCAPGCGKSRMCCEGRHWSCESMPETDPKFCPHCGWQLGPGGVASSRGSGIGAGTALAIVGITSVEPGDSTEAHWQQVFRAALAADGVDVTKQADNAATTPGGE